MKIKFYTPGERQDIVSTIDSANNKAEASRQLATKYDRSADSIYQLYLFEKRKQDPNFAKKQVKAKIKSLKTTALIVDTFIADDVFAMGEGIVLKGSRDQRLKLAQSLLNTLTA